MVVNTTTQGGPSPSATEEGAPPGVVRSQVGCLQLDIMDTLATQPGLSAREIADDIGSNGCRDVRRALDGLRKRGIVRRWKSAHKVQRPQVYALTPWGRELYDLAILRGRVPGVAKTGERWSR